MAGSNAKFVWYELMTSNVDAAAAFYEEVVAGWAPQDAGMGEPYTLMMIGEAQVAGLMGTPPDLQAIGAPSEWAGYVAVDDVEAMAARALAAGGKVLKPGTDIPGIGRFAILADPGGAKFMLFKPLRDDPPPTPAPEAPGTVGWHELRAADWKVAFEFYSGLFGWTKGETHDMGPMGVYQVFQIDGVDAGGMMDRADGMPPPAWGYYFRVAGINAAADRVKKGGGQVVMGPHPVPGGLWVLIGVDPQGAAFHLVSPTP